MGIDNKSVIFYMPLKISFFVRIIFLSLDLFLENFNDDSSVVTIIVNIKIFGESGEIPEQLT